MREWIEGQSTGKQFKSLGIGASVTHTDSYKT